MLPTGKGYFTWQLINCEDGSPEEIAQVAKDAGLQHVLVKVADGAGNYNISVDLPAIIRALNLQDIEVWGWQYCYGYSPMSEARKALQKINELNLTGFIIDAEAQYKGKFAEAVLYMKTLKDGSGNTPIGLSSYRYPSYHREFPWDSFRSNGVDFDMPQVYWEQSHNPGYQLQKSYEEFGDMAPVLPYVPTGSAYSRGGWAPTVGDIEEFMQKAQELNMPSINFWEWMNTRNNLPHIWKTISEFEWGEEPPVIPEPPTPIEESDVIEIVKELQEEFPEAIINININLDGDEPSDPVVPPGPEPVPSTIEVKVTRSPRTNARFIKGFNDAGYPIMEIFPSDTSTVSERVQFSYSAIVNVLPEKVRADGGGYFWIIDESEHDEEVDLFLKADEVARV